MQALSPAKATVPNSTRTTHLTSTYIYRMPLDLYPGAPGIAPAPPRIRMKQQQHHITP